MLARSPVLARVLPFAAFALLTVCQGWFGEVPQYWIYALKTLLSAWLLWQVRSHAKEMRWNFSWEAVVVGIVIFAAWVGLDGYYPMLVHRSGAFNPPRTFGGGSTAWIFIGIRLAGSSVVVPPLEEVFYRSFLYRYAVSPDFLSVPLNRFDWKAFLLVGAVFGAGHFEWLAGILCAFAYQALVIRKNRLGDAMTAHAITNFLLGVWVVGRNAYYFW